MELSLLTTGGKCFFCLGDSNCLSGVGKLENIFSIRSLLQYLGLDANKKKGPLVNNHQGLQQLVICCESCSNLFCQFQDWFKLWQEAEMRLSSCVRELGRRLIAGSDNNDDKRSSNSVGIKLDPTITELRERVGKKCRNRASPFQPEVVLQSVDSKPRGNSDQEAFKIKTEFRYDGNDHACFGETDVEPEVDEMLLDMKFVPPPNPQVATSLPLADPNATLKPEDQEETLILKKYQNTFVRNYKIRPDPSRPGNYRCELCHRSFKGLPSCRVHYRSVHLNMGHGPAECQICHKILADRFTLKRHTNMVHNYQTTSCIHCGKPFKLPSYKDKHELECESNPAATPRQVKCKSCQKTFPGQAELNKHKDKEHADVLKFRCETCGNRFRDQGRLQAHIENIHERKARLSCHFCEKRFSYEDGLKEHVNSVHLKIPKYRCPFCGDKFISFYLLKKHQRTAHPGIKIIN